jgi:acetate---CoA ligase (ADP-forming)
MKLVGGALPEAGSPLDAVYAPRGVVVIGASRDARKRGHQAVRALLDGGYRGAIHPVNPSGGELCGLRVWPSVEAVQGVAELALICTPAETVAARLEECGRAGIRAAVVLAVGFGEAGAAGAALEADLAAAAARSGVRVVGPNTSGVLNPRIGLNLIGVHGVRPGPLALLVQSGNVALAVLTEAAATCAAGFSMVAGVGNECDVRVHEHVEWIDRDAGSRGVLMHVEGVRDVRSFLEVARNVARRKPVVLLKGGRSEAGRAAARSHTGAVAGEHMLLRDALWQAGVVEVQRSDELLPAGLMLTLQPPLRAGGGVAVLTDGGGHGTLAADALAGLGVRAACISARGQARLRAQLGAAAAVANPVDLAGAADRDPAIFAETLRILLEEEDVGGVVVAGLFGGYGIRFAAELGAAEAVAAGAMADAAGAARTPLIVHTLYARHGSDALRRLRTAGVPVVESLEVACRCIAASAERAAFLERASQARAYAPRRAPAPQLLTEAGREGRDTLLETEARALVAEYGVTVVPGRHCADEESVAQCAAASAGPLAAKLVSATLSHKARAGGVILGLEGVAAAVAAFRRIRSAAAEHAARQGITADFRGVLLTPMLPAPRQELIVGARRDEAYGELLTVGGGGSEVEAVRDVAVHMLPIAAEDVLPLLARTRAGAALLRASAPADPGLDSLVRLVLSLADCFQANEGIAELELNPVFVSAEQAIAIDARAYVSRPGADQPSTMAS